MSTLVERLDNLELWLMERAACAEGFDQKRLHEQEAAIVREAAAALRATGVWEWVRVPREPTPEMMEAGWDAGEGNETPDYANAYRAMLAAAPTPAATINPPEIDIKLIEPLRDAGAVAWVRRWETDHKPWTWRLVDYDGAACDGIGNYVPLYAHPDPQQPAITGAMVSDALGIPRGDAALILQVEDGDRKINGRWLSHLPAAAARINAALTAAAKEGVMNNESPDVIGPPAPMPTKREEWMAKYVLRMVERGVDQEAALACYQGAADDHDYSADPAEAADDELSYWTDDGVAAAQESGS